MILLRIDPVAVIEALTSSLQSGGTGEVFFREWKTCRASRSTNWRAARQNGRIGRICATGIGSTSGCHGADAGNPRHWECEFRMRTKDAPAKGFCCSASWSIINPDGCCIWLSRPHRYHRSQERGSPNRRRTRICPGHPAFLAGRSVRPWADGQAVIVNESVAPGPAKAASPCGEDGGFRKDGGRYWTRTSDPVRVKHVL